MAREFDSLQSRIQPRRLYPQDPSREDPIRNFLSPGEMPMPVAPGTRERFGDPTKIISGLGEILRERQRQQDQPQPQPGSIPSYGGVRAELPPSLNKPMPRQGSNNSFTIPSNWIDITGGGQ